MYGFRVAHNTISKLIPEVCEAIIAEFSEELVPVPTTPEEWNKISDDFSSRWNSCPWTFVAGLAAAADWKCCRRLPETRPHPLPTPNAWTWTSPLVVLIATEKTKYIGNIKRMELIILQLAGLPGFARDSCSIIMYICAFHFYIIYFHFFSADHGIPQTFDYILTT